MRAVPEAAVNIVAEFEGFEPKAYRCPAGVWTIGYGHTKNVTPVMTCTEEEARTLLRDDLFVAADTIRRVLGPDKVDTLTSNQYAALISFVYNCGLNARWGIVRVIREGRLNAVPAELAKFVNAAGKRLPGLVRRRAAEGALWSQP